MDAEVERRLNMLTADCLVYEQVIAGLLAAVPEVTRQEIASNTREILDALSANQGVTARGQETIPQTYQALARLLREPPSEGASPRPDDPSRPA